MLDTTENNKIDYPGLEESYSQNFVHNQINQLLGENGLLFIDANFSGNENDPNLTDWNCSVIDRNN